MDASRFVSVFNRYFPPDEIDKPTPMFAQAFTRSFFDPCFLVEGFTSIKVQQLLSIAYALLPEDEAYFEVGTYQGKTLISAMVNNELKPAYACDNFSEFTASAEGSAKVLDLNLQMYHLKDRVTFFNADFQTIVDKDHIPHPVGVYLYDGMHTEEMQYLGVKLVEPLLADEALVIIDDWNMPEAKEGTQRAIDESEAHYEPLYYLPAHAMGDREMWWEGIGVFRFLRK